MRKNVLITYAANPGPNQPVHPTYVQELHCLLLESLDTVEHSDWKRKPCSNYMDYASLSKSSLNRTYMERFRKLQLVSTDTV